MEKTTKLSVSFPRDFAERLRKDAEAEGRTISGLLRFAYKRFKGGDSGATPQ
jgi:hypothetical protein